MDNRPIGVFDSGMGGLTALRELIRLLPGEDMVYFGDNARIPYGTKSPEVIKRFALQDARFLAQTGVKAMLVACGTVSSTCIEDIRKAFPEMPVIGVVAAAAKKAAALALAEKEKDGVIVLGTSATVKAGAFPREIAKYGDIAVESVACPMFVPLVENGFTAADDTVANAVTEKYLAPFRGKRFSCAILGCTHYPLLSDVIAKQLPGCALISSGSAAAEEAAETLERAGLKNGGARGTVRFYTSDEPEMFSRSAAYFLGESAGIAAEKVEIERY